MHTAVHNHKTACRPREIGPSGDRTRKVRHSRFQEGARRRPQSFWEQSGRDFEGWAMEKRGFPALCERGGSLVQQQQVTRTRACMQAELEKEVAYYAAVESEDEEWID